jgi:hypothetical protein
MEHEYIHKEREHQDWAYLLRLSKKRFPEDKTVHILFGQGGLGRKAAVNYFIKHYPTICKEWGSDDYLLAAKVNSKGIPVEGFDKNLLN